MADVEQLELLHLPDDVLEKIVTSLPLNSIPKFASCNSALRNIAYSESVWKHFYVLDCETEELGRHETYRDGCIMGSWQPLAGKVFSLFWADVQSPKECTFLEDLTPVARTRSSHPFDKVPAARYYVNGVPTLEFRGDGGWKEVKWRYVVHRVLPSMWRDISVIDPRILEFCRLGELFALQVMRAGRDDHWFQGVFTSRADSMDASVSLMPIHYPDMLSKYGGEYEGTEQEDEINTSWRRCWLYDDDGETEGDAEEEEDETDSEEEDEEEE